MSNRAEIQRDVTDNPKLKEIFDILLMAGYFRIRIPSIKPFDKILGGLVWSITCSNYDIDIDYNDDIKLGEKIKLSEKVCALLKEMKCPYSLQPFQIQGLDSNSIFPVIQWLIKFVYETREQRQDFNKTMSNFCGKNVYKSFGIKENQDKDAIIGTQNEFLKGKNDQRVSKNKKIKKTAKSDPLRIYSTLIEYGDVTAYKTYNKLCAIMSGKISLHEKGGKISQKASQFEKNNNTEENNDQQVDVNSLLFHGSSNIDSNNKRKYSDNEQDYGLDEDQIGNFKEIAGISEKIGDQLIQLIDGEQISNALEKQNNNSGNNQDGDDDNEDDPLNMMRMIENQKKFHDGQINNMNNKVNQLEQNLQELSDELYELKEKEEGAEQMHDQHIKLYEEFSQTINNIQNQIDEKETANPDLKNKLEGYVQQKNELIEEKKQKIREIRVEQEKLQQQKEQAENKISQYTDNEEYIQNLYAEVAEKKEKYDIKFKQLAVLNQEIAVLQRKHESIPSPTEIAQYHQRLQELFENINIENLKFKDKYIQFNTGTDVKDMLSQFVEIMRTFKDDFNANRKSKSGRENFLNQLADTRAALINNMNKTLEFAKRQDQQCAEKVVLLQQQIQLEREYFKLLKELHMEFERGDELQQSINQYQQQGQQQYA